MRSFGVVLVEPAIGDSPHLLKSVKQIGVQHIFAIGRIETFNVRILSGVARFDEIAKQVMVGGPGDQGMCNELRTVVAADGALASVS
jgi:hypothetical protein